MTADRIIKERYKYTSLEQLLTEGKPPLRGDLLSVEASPTLFEDQIPESEDLTPWATEEVTSDPLWQDNLNTKEDQVQGVKINITEDDGVAEGVIYLHIYYPLETEKTPQKAVFRNIISLEEDTQARVVIYHHHSDNEQLTVNALTAIELKTGAKLELVEVAETKALMGDTIVVRQSEGSELKLTAIDLDNQLLRRNQFVTLKKQEARCELSGLFLTGGTQQADNYVKMIHAHGKCESDQLFKGVATGQSTGNFTGHIYVAKDAQETVALQQNHNIVLSDDARINTRPQLEIYADDVKCNHGATIGKLDDEAIYYMRQRGIGLEAAKRLQISGFVGEILERFEIDDLQHLLRTKITQRLTRQ